jgi:hypothetical protein
VKINVFFGAVSLVDASINKAILAIKHQSSTADPYWIYSYSTLLQRAQTHNAFFITSVNFYAWFPL